MTTFKAFLHILNRCKGPIILYTVMLFVFGGLNIQTSENTMSFTATKPDVLIVNHDEEVGITQNLIDYFEERATLVDVSDRDDARSDALFYRDVSYIMTIPKGYRENFLAGLDPVIAIEKTGDYEASLAEMMLSKYLRLTSFYRDLYDNEEDILTATEDTLSHSTEVEVASTLDATSLSKATFYYNFLSYAMLATTIYVICMILASFHEEKVKKRTIVSSMNDRKQNRILLAANSLFAFVLWLFYLILSFVLCGKVLWSMQGMLYALNSLIFTFCAVTIAFLISNILNNKNAINGIMNVVALGSSFLCGAFVPVELLPKWVLGMAHVLPTYWYIDANQLLKTLDVYDFEHLAPILRNMGVVILFSLGFILLSNYFSQRKQKLD